MIDAGGTDATVPPPVITPPPPPPAPSPTGAPIGMNLEAVTYWSNAVPFVDLMKQSDRFMSTNAAGGGAWNSGLAEQIPRDADGYPVEIPYSVNGVPQVVHTIVGQMLYAGDYVLLYDGDGDFDVIGDNLQVTSRAAGRYVLHVSAASTSSIFFTIRRSNKADHVHNVRVIAPGFEGSYASSPFHPAYLANLQGVGVVRFMDWGRTNDSTVTHWSERAKPGAFQGTQSGVSIEDMCALANTLAADAWVNVPHLADDDYVTQMATVIRDRLNPGQRVYIEYSNEVWNAIFDQMHWASEQGCALDLDAVGPYAGNCDTDSGAHFWAGEKWVARRSAQIFQIFAKVFGGTQRLVRVLAGQSANPSLNDTLLDAFEDPNVNPLLGQTGVGVDAIAIAPYCGGGIGDELEASGQAATITVSGILDKLQNQIATEITQNVKANYAIAQQHGVRLVAYEGGQHLVGNGAAQSDDALTQKLIAANRDPRMYDIYKQMFDAWYTASGNGTFTVFSYISAPAKYGSWGVLETQTQASADAPKLRAYRERVSALAQ